MHVDMDAFFVSVELLDRPELRGKPVVVGGAGSRGVVAAASYEARAYGVHSAMSSIQAQRLCPHAVFLRGRHGRYGEVSERVMAILRDVTPLVEPLSLDEAFCDITGSLRRLGSSRDIAAEVRRRVFDEQGLTCSVGLASTKFVAKLATEQAKPRAGVGGNGVGLGVFAVEPADTLAFLHPLPVQALWGVGPATLARMHRIGVMTIGDLAALPVESAVASLGRSHGAHLHALANGVDERVVEPSRAPKSIGHEETFAADHHERATHDRELVAFADAVAARLRAHGLLARTVQLKVRFGDFHTITRSLTLASGVDDSRSILTAARSLLEQVDPTPGVRLLGLSMAGFSPADTRQLTLDDALAGPGWGEASRTVDEIRARFGDAAIGQGSTVGPEGLRPKRRGSQQWGPDA